MFPKPGAFSMRSGSVLTKAWTNRLLEQNATPAFWVSNAIDQIDRSYVRRFDLVLEIAQPPRRVRRNLLERRAQSAGRLKQRLKDGSAEQALSRELLTFKKPGTGIRADRVGEVIGKKALRDLPKDHMLTEKDFQ